MMKKTLFCVAALFVVAFFYSNQALAQNLKIGYVQIDSVLTKMPEYKAAQSEVQSLSNLIRKDLQAKQQQMQAKYTEYQNGVEGMTPTMRKQKEEELTKLQQDFQKQQAEAEERLQNKQQTLLFPIYDKIRNAITEVGKENGYTLIFNELDGSNTQYILYSAEGTNATNLVITKLGL